LLEDLNQRLASVQRLNMPADAVYGVSPRTRNRRDKSIPGGAFACPVCGGRFRRFLPFGLNGRRNARCPGCGSLERHRFMWLHLRDRHRLLQRRSRLLHIAPEHCIRDALAANPALRYVSVDMFDPDADRAADLTALPFRDDSFDFAICSHVLEHIEDDRAAMDELFRVLVPGGRAVVMVPIEMDRPQTYEDSSIDSAAGRNEAFGHPYHVRVCGADYPDRLRRAGFTAKLVYSRSMTPHMRRFWRINKTVLFDCRKP
jgi:predicted SAM-dependent methyltransferase